MTNNSTQNTTKKTKDWARKKEYQFPSMDKQILFHMFIRLIAYVNTHWWHETKDGFWLRQLVHIHRHLLNRYSITANQLVTASIHLWRNDLNFSTWNSWFNNFFVTSMALSRKPSVEIHYQEYHINWVIFCLFSNYTCQYLNAFKIWVGFNLTVSVVFLISCSMGKRCVSQSVKQNRLFILQRLSNENLIQTIRMLLVTIINMRLVDYFTTEYSHFSRF